MELLVISSIINFLHMAILHYKINYLLILCLKINFTLKKKKKKKKERNCIAIRDNTCVKTYVCFVIMPTIFSQKWCPGARQCSYEMRRWFCPKCAKGSIPQNAEFIQAHEKCISRSDWCYFLSEVVGNPLVNKYCLLI